MTDWKKWMCRILCPPVWVVLPLILVSTGGMATVFLLGYDTHPLGYTVFVLSAYALTAAVFRCIKRLPACIRDTRTRLERMPIVGRYMTDDAYKVMILIQDENYSYPGLMIFAVAAFTSCSLAVAVTYMIHYRKYKSPVLSDSRAVQLTAALVSLMTLESAMLEAFSEGNVVFDDTVKTLTAIGVYLIALSLSIGMIIRGATGMKRIKQERAGAV